MIRNICGSILSVSVVLAAHSLAENSVVVSKAKAARKSYLMGEGCYTKQGKDTVEEIRARFH